ncbi:hypothetical protein [Micromonospora okii]|uniref:hypothetical protein n=1 Tax=Micromonospora okii TaxID=1182970 RepID=UPI001E31CDB7|nr:hypothetical protein [Micromonospora okii]
MPVRNRLLARLGAAALLASGALTALSAPAHAEGAGTDLSLDVAGTRVAANVGGKVAFIKISNRGANPVSRATVQVDVTELDAVEIEAIPRGDECEEARSDGRRIWSCLLFDDTLPKPGRTGEMPLLVLKGDDAAGPRSAPVTFTLTSPDDTTPENNTKTVRVEFTEESGVDLGVRVPDVTRHIPPDEYDPDTEGFPALQPGKTTVLIGEVFNQGDLVTDGVRVVMRLPKGVTFADRFADCEHSADRRTATCEIEDLQLGDGGSALSFLVPIKVGASVKGPVALKPGTVTAEALGQLTPEQRRSRKATAPKLPSVAKLVPAKEVDPSDNSDDFAVIVIAASNGGGNGGSGGGSGLPVTGPQAGLIGGIGAAVLAVGGVLLVLARRRRVVLVAPTDEKPTA